MPIGTYQPDHQSSPSSPRARRRPTNMDSEVGHAHPARSSGGSRSARATAAARKLPTIDVTITRIMACAGQLRSSAARSSRPASGRLRRCCRYQNMKAQWAVSDKRADQDRQHRGAADRAAEQVGDAAAVPSPAWSLAACHSSGSGTARRIQTTSSAGRMPTRNTYAVRARPT